MSILLVCPPPPSTFDNALSCEHPRLCSSTRFRGFAFGPTLQALEKPSSHFVGTSLTFNLAEDPRFKVVKSVPVETQFPVSSLCIPLRNDCFGSLCEVVSHTTNGGINAKIVEASVYPSWLGKAIKSHKYEFPSCHHRSSCSCLVLRRMLIHLPSSNLSSWKFHGGKGTGLKL